MDDAGLDAGINGIDVPEVGVSAAGGAVSRRPGQALQTALLDSRLRWKDLVALACDVAFEVAADGTFVFVSPETVLGWPAGELLGRRADELLADLAEPSPFSPDRRSERTVWLRRADGGQACLALACRPLFGAAGQQAGCRGVGRDVTERELGEAALAAALRRAEVLDHILRQMRQEVLAPRMMATTLQALIGALGADGAALVDGSGDMSARYVVGQRPLPGCGHRLTCALDGRHGEGTALMLWRSAERRPWDGEERHLADSATAIVRVILDHQAIQLEMARQARTDPLTGLLNRRAFLEEAGRRIDRLAREDLPGTLMYVDLDRFKSINDDWGHDVGDVALCVASAVLRRATRPADLVARLGGDEFVMWLDGADQLTAAERAEDLCLDAENVLVVDTPEGSAKLSLSIGIACRPAGSDEDIAGLMHRADLAMYEVKQTGRGHWHVAAPLGEPARRPSGDVA